MRTFSAGAVLAGIAMAAMVLAWLLPNHYPPWYAVYNESAMFVAVALLAAAQGRAWLTARVSATAGVVLAVAAVPLLQFALGQLRFADDAWVSTVFLVGLGVAIATGQLAASRDPAGTARQLAIAVVIGGVLSSALAALQGFQAMELGIYGLDAYRGMRAYANFAQPNHLATLLGWSVLGLLLLYEQRRLGAVAAVALLALFVAGAALSQSKTALLYGPAILLAYALAARRGVSLRTSKAALFLGIAAHWGLTWAWPRLQGPLLLASTPSLGERSVDAGRLDAWRFFLDAVQHAPWLGFGWLQTAAGQFAVALEHPPIREKVWFQSHNLFLDLVLWCGIPLGVLIGAAVLYWFFDRAARVSTLESVLALLAVTLAGIHAMLEYPLHYAYFLLPAGLWIGQIEASLALRRTMPALWAGAPGILAAALLIAAAREYPALEEDFRLVRFENLRIGSLRATRPAPDAPLFPSLTAYLTLFRTPVDGPLSDATLERIEATVRRYPFSGALYRCAIALAANGRLEEATLVFERIRHIQGEAAYAKLRDDLRDRIEAGNSRLVPLEQALAQ